jgi:uncharacterized membrane protein
MYLTSHATFLGLIFFQISRTVVSTCSAGIALSAIGLLPAKNDIAQARGLDKIVAFGNLCFAIPLAVFGAEHFTDAKSIMELVPAYVPGRLFWTYFVGVALLAASLSIATKIQVRWSGLLFGIMMFLFVAMMDLPGALANRHERIPWVLLLREMSFGGGAWCLAGLAMEGGRVQGKSRLVTVGRVILGIAAIFYSVQHFLHPTLAPGVPLQKPMAAWIPARAVIGYLTGMILLVSGVCILLAKKTRMAATYLGTWIVLLVLFVYGPMLIAALLDPSTAVKVEGINYFFDTLLFAGAILALAGATQRSD